jgi:hypothetical protein
MELVVTLHTIKPVRIAVTGDPIVAVRTNDILDVDKGVGLVEVVGVRIRVVAFDEARPRSSRQVDVESDQAGNVPRRNVVKVGYGVVAVAAIDEVVAPTPIEVVIASAAPNIVIADGAVDKVETVGPDQNVVVQASIDNRHGRALSRSGLKISAPAHCRRNSFALTWQRCGPRAGPRWPCFHPLIRRVTGRGGSIQV